MGISKLLYLSAVLCVPKWVISKINNLVWPFLWGSRIETVSRMTCHQSLGKGGLGIFNFQTKSDSLKLASLICNLEDRESKSFFLTKYFLGSRLASCRPEWRSLRDNSTPSTQNLTPYYEKNIFRFSPLFAGLFPAKSGRILFSPPRGAIQLS